MLPSTASQNFERILLGTWPTPLQPMDALRTALGGARKCPRLWMKHEDLLALGLGGSKIRKLEFIAGKALAEGVDTLINVGVAQSNQIRQTAATAARLGMECHLVIPHPVIPLTPIYEETGNILICRLLGAHLHFMEDRGDYMATMHTLAEEARSRGRTPLIIPVGAVTPEGSMGSALCAEEVWDQCAVLGFQPDWVVVAIGSASSCAGMAVGLEALRQERGGTAPKVLGVEVLGPDSRSVPVEDFLRKYMMEVAGILDITMPANVLRHEELLSCGPVHASATQLLYSRNFVGPGFGKVDALTLDALRFVARTEGILLDPVYTGKTMAALLSGIHKGLFRPDENVVFLHTGGQPALSAYAPLLV